MSRDNIVQTRLNEKESNYLSELAERFGVSESEAIRIVLFDSRFLYSEDVSFGEINVPKNKVINEKDSETTNREAADRITN